MGLLGRRTARSHALAMAVGAAVAALCSPARAQDGKAVAEALFRDGRDLLAAGDTSAACAKFAMSQRIEPKLGTLLNLASCHEADGKTASAWAEFTEAIAVAARTNQPEREQFARDHVKGLTERLSRVRIAAAGDRQVSVQLDGLVVDRSVLGTAIPLDPGPHTLVVTASHGRPHETKIVVPAGPSLTELDVRTLAPDEPEHAAPRAGPRVTPAAQPHASPDGSRRLAWAAFGAGAVGLAAGTYFGLQAISKSDDAAALCDADSRYCSREGVAREGIAELSADASTVAFGVGLVAVGVGVWFLARAPKEPAPRAAGSGLHAGAKGLSATW